MSHHPLTRRRAQKKIHNKLEASFRKAAAAGEQRREKLRTLAQRAKYNSGAAKSPTPPPRKSFARDEKTLKLLSVIEKDCRDKKSVIVRALAENFLHEQGLIAAEACTHAVWTDADLDLAIDASRDIKEAKRILARLKGRLQYKKVPVRLYNWDKTTPVLKAVFYSWAMPLARTRPFSVTPSAEIIAGAKASTTAIPTYFQDRLRKLLSRRGAVDVENWLVVEAGGSHGMHLHGAITFPDDKASQDAIHDGLKKLSGNPGSTAIHIGRFSDEFGWATYCLKHARFSQMLVGGNQLSGSRTVQQKAKSIYDEFHSEYRSLLNSSSS